jgi:hypothetical protein
MVNGRHIREHKAQVIHSAEHLLVQIGKAQVTYIFFVANKNVLAQLIKMVLQSAPRMREPVTKTSNTTQTGLCWSYPGKELTEDTNMISFSVKRTSSFKQKRTRASMSALRLTHKASRWKVEISKFWWKVLLHLMRARVSSRSPEIRSIFEPTSSKRLNLVERNETVFSQYLTLKSNQKQQQQCHV